MASVQILPEVVANQIAAGEVVERPASVVKELVENSLDASASRVRVDIENDARDLIVTDDGIGMERGDAERALMRFATSKIRESDDLHDVASYGFRGEALPSIASISRLRLITRPHDRDVACQIDCVGGEVEGVREVAAPPGTRIEVRDLFFNTPARAKFLKTAGTEIRRVVQAVSRLSLAAEHVGFEVQEGGRVAVQIAADATLAERLGALHGAKMARQMYGFTHEHLGVMVTGLLGAPTLARSRGDRLYIFVNDRYVLDRTIASALREAYRSLIPKGKSPAAVVCVRVEPSQVDVNVHPAKHEVRFADSQRVWRAVYRGARDVLESAPWGLSVTSTWRKSSAPAARAASAAAVARLPMEDVPGIARPRLEVVRGAAPEAAPAQSEQTPDDDRPFAFQSLRVLGQFGSTYLVCERGDDLYLLDQHAAHERVVFERLRALHRGQEPSIQRLLVPDMIELSPPEERALEEVRDKLAALGFEISPFGGRTYAIHSVPSLLSRARASALVSETLLELSEGERTDALDDSIDAVLARMACHTAIRAGDSVSTSEARQLLSDLDSVPYAANCPHGRPVVVRIEREEIERWFGRDYC